jgi:hypothetical protein
MSVFFSGVTAFEKLYRALPCRHEFLFRLAASDVGPCPAIGDLGASNFSFLVEVASGLGGF